MDALAGLALGFVFGFIVALTIFPNESREKIECELKNGHLVKKEHQELCLESLKVIE